jgi:HAMP domain-containing protein
MSSKLAGIAPETRKKQKIKVQFDVVVRTIDELPSKYSDGKKGELFIEYKKGSGSKNKGSTKMFKPTGSKQMTLNADLTFTVNLTKDLTTGTFDKKIVEFSLKFRRYKSVGLKKDYKVGSLPLDITTFAPSSTFMDVKSFELTGKHKDKTTKTILTLQVKSNYQKIDGKLIRRVKSKRILGREDSINSTHSESDGHIITVGTEQFVVETNEDTSEANNSEFTHDTEGSVEESMTENDEFSDDQPTLVAPVAIDSTNKSPRDGKSPRRNDSGSGLSPGRRERSRSVNAGDSKTNSNAATPVKRDSRNSVQFADTKIIVPPLTPGDNEVGKADSNRAMLKDPSILLIENYNPNDPPLPSNNVNTNNTEVMTLREANDKMKKEVEMAKDEIKQLKEALSKMKQQLRDKNKAGGTGTAATPSTPSAPLEQQNTTSENKEEIDKLQKKVKELTETLANQNQVHATEIARLTANVTALQKDSENTLSLLAQSKQQLELKDKQIKTLQETSLTAAANNNNINNVSLRTRRKELIQSALKSPLTPEEEQYTLAIILFVFIILSILI